MESWNRSNLQAIRVKLALNAKHLLHDCADGRVTTNLDFLANVICLSVQAHKLKSASTPCHHHPSKSLQFASWSPVSPYFAVTYLVNIYDELIPLVEKAGTVTSLDREVKDVIERIVSASRKTECRRGKALASDGS